MEDGSLAKICLELGSDACQRGDYSLASSLFEAACSTPEAKAAALAVTLEKVASIYAEQNQPDKASDLRRKSFSIYKELVANTANLSV